MSASNAGTSDRTLPMTVANTGFMLDRLGQDCSPLQFVRELTQNAIEAVRDADPDESAEIVWDVDWDRLDLTGVLKLCIIDPGIGMTGEEQVRYVNQLSSSVHEQSHDGNFGVGAKIAAATRNHEGLIYLSWKDGIGSMIHLWRDPDSGDYGLRQIERPDGTYGHFGLIEDTLKPKQIDQHGTKVVLLGNATDQDTMTAPEGAASPSKWIRRYLNTRYFRFPDKMTIRVREGWDQPRSNSDLNVLRQVTGQEAYLEQHALDKGTVDLKGAVVHWWILEDGPSLGGNSGFVASKGHMAALYQGELYEMVEARAGAARLQLFGVMFGYQRVVIYVEPINGDVGAVTSNTARTNLLVNGESLPWADWANEFRSKLPEPIKALIDEVATGAASANHKDAIRDRLKRIRELFKFSRYKPSQKGTNLVDVENLTKGSRGRRGDAVDASRKGSGGSRAGDVYALFLKADGSPADAVHGDPIPDVFWVSTTDGSREYGIIEDRAAKYMVEQNTLQINADFRAFTDMVTRYSSLYSEVPGAVSTVEDVVREWFEQQLVEAILGVQSLKDSREWTIQEISAGWSEEALTAAVMPRYHIDNAIRRALGSRLGAINEKAS